MGQKSDVFVADVSFPLIHRAACCEWRQIVGTEVLSGVWLQGTDGQGKIVPWVKRLQSASRTSAGKR